MNHYDVIIVGTGSMGISTAAYLGKAGIKVLALDPHSGPHDFGSHSGKTRIIRQSYFEHPSYVPLLLRSYELWNDLELQTNTRSEVYHQTGLIYMGPESSKVIQGINESAITYNLALKEVKQTHFTIPTDWKVYYEEKAGFIDVHKTFQSYFAIFNKKYVDYKNEKLLSWQKNDGSIRITTNQQEYTSDKIIFTSGAWTAELLKEYNLPLQVTKQTIAWLDIAHTEQYKEGNFPCWFISDPAKGMYYGFPITNGKENGLKLALHEPGKLIDPGKKDPTVSPAEIEDISYCLKEYLPNIQVSRIQYETCLYTYSPDEHFIIDYLPDSGEKIMVACGFSGHGFKFVPVIGEILTNMVTGRPNVLGIDFLKMDRFGR